MHFKSFQGMINPKQENMQVKSPARNATVWVIAVDIPKFSTPPRRVRMLKRERTTVGIKSHISRLLIF